MQEGSSKEMLLALLRREWDPDLPEGNWQGLVKLAEHHGIVPLLYQRLKDDRQIVPPDVMQAMHQVYLRSAVQNTRLFHHLSGVLALLHAEEIPVIVLKGAFLAERIYQNIAVRPMSDVDLLVREEDLGKVDQLLEGLGFNRLALSTERLDEEHAFAYLQGTTKLLVEIHWGLTHSSYALEVDTNRLWQKARATVIADIPVSELSPEDQILHLCVHAAVHVFEMGLRAMCDVDATIRFYQNEIDWECLRQRATDWKAERSVYICLRLVKDLLATPVRDNWLETLRPDGAVDEYLKFASEHLFKSVENPERAIPEAVGVVRFWSAAHWGGRLSILIRRLFPSRKEMAKMYPASSRSLRIFFYYPVRLVDLLRRYGRLGVKLLRGEAQTIAQAERQKEVNEFRDWLIMGKG